MFRDLWIIMLIVGYAIWTCFSLVDIIISKYNNEEFAEYTITWILTTLLGLFAASLGYWLLTLPKS